MNDENYMIVPKEPTEEMIRAMLAVRWPATYRDYLRHPLAGPETQKQQEKDIAIVRKEYLAALAVVRNKNKEA